MIKIYDDDHFICKTNTYCGKTIVCLNNGIYRLEIILKGKIYYRYIYVRDEVDIYDIILFGTYIVNNTRTITFLLTDSYYDNLPIERGNLTLWQT